MEVKSRGDEERDRDDGGVSEEEKRLTTPEDVVCVCVCVCACLCVCVCVLQLILYKLQKVHSQQRARRKGDSTLEKSTGDLDKLSAQRALRDSLDAHCRVDFGQLQRLAYLLPSHLCALGKACSRSVSVSGAT